MKQRGAKNAQKIICIACIEWQYYIFSNWKIMKNSFDNVNFPEKEREKQKFDSEN